MSEIRVDTISEKTSANGVAIDSVTLKDGGVTATAASTIPVTDNSDTLSLISTDADANVGPVLRLYRNSASAVDNDVIGNLIFSGNDTAGNETDYLTFQVNAGDADDGQEDGFMRILMPVASSSTEFVRLTPAEVVFNEGSVDLDLRVESDVNTSSLIVEGSSGHVGFGVSNPSSVIDVRNGVGERQAFVFMGVNQDTVAMAIMSSYALSSQTATMIQFLDFNGTERGSIKTSGSATAYNTSSY